MRQNRLGIAGDVGLIAVMQVLNLRVFSSDKSGFGCPSNVDPVVLGV